MIEILCNFFSHIANSWCIMLGISYSHAGIRPNFLAPWAFRTGGEFMWYEPYWFLLISGSGTILFELDSQFFQWISEIWWIFLTSIIVSAIIDYLILSEISAFYQQKISIKSHNSLFSWIFVLWRIFIPDIFIVSTLTALVTKITFSKKQILGLVFLAHILRIAFMVFLMYSIQSGIGESLCLSWKC
ncbi:hypothetical protein HG442_002295 [Candidatus Gracilibacteria bacterium]|nr:hypothetical protein [Candidatus Gracilibacteria bacterium]